jgi:hypothetical protein
MLGVVIMANSYIYIYHNDVRFIWIFSEYIILLHYNKEKKFANYDLLIKVLRIYQKYEQICLQI